MKRYAWVLLIFFNACSLELLAEDEPTPLTPPVVSEQETAPPTEDTSPPTVESPPPVPEPTVSEEQDEKIAEAQRPAAESIQGGDSYANALPLGFDQDYQLNHHQKVGYFDYFYFDLQTGQKMTVELRTYEKGINLHGDIPLEEGAPYAGAEIHDSHQKKLQSGNIVGVPYSTETITYTAETTGRHYLLIGSTYNAINKDHMSFKITTRFQGDLDGQRDAGDTIADAMTVETGRYQKNFIGPKDAKDVFSFEGEKGETYFAGIIPNEDSGTFFQVSIFDSYKQKILSEASGVNEGIKTSPFVLPDNGLHYIQIELGGPIEKPLQYIFELNRLNAASPAVKEARPTPPAAATPAPRKKPPPAAAPASTSPPPRPQPPPPSTPPPSLDGAGPRAMPSETAIPPES